MKKLKQENCYVCGSNLIDKGLKKDKEGRICSHKECSLCGHEEHWYDLNKRLQGTL